MRHKGSMPHMSKLINRIVLFLTSHTCVVQNSILNALFWAH